MFLAIILMLLILSVLVLVHEFGHFIVAKLNGIRVEEFGLGLPPRIFGKQFGETTYTLNALPFGGFVKLTGEDSEETTGTATSNPRSFAFKKPWQRIAVLVAGVTMNLVLAFTVFYSYFLFNNFNSGKIPLFFDYSFKFGKAETIDTFVSQALDDYPAKSVGIEAGDIIKDVNGLAVRNVEDLRSLLSDKSGKEVSIGIIDSTDDSYKKLKLSPKNSAEGNPSIGVYLGRAVVLNYGSSLKDKILSAPYHSYNVMAYSLKGMGEIISISWKNKDVRPVSETVSGPIGMLNIVDQIMKFGGIKALWILLDFVGLMSLSLAFINIMPFPALDGGRVMFVLIEMLIGKRVSPRIENLFHQAGMIFLLALMGLITIKDIIFF